MSIEHHDLEMDTRLADWAQDRQFLPVHPDAAAQIQRVIVARMQERSRARVRQAVLLAAAVLLAVFALRGPQADNLTPTPAGETAQTAHHEPLMGIPAPEAVAQAPQIEVLHAEGDAVRDTRRPKVGAEGRMVLSLGEDRLGLGANSALQLESAEIEETRIRLDRGVVAAQVASRGETGSFQILVGEAVVEVIGTRFGVLRSVQGLIRVWVAEGMVQVQWGPRSWKLTAGQQLEIDEQGHGSVVELTNAVTELQDLLSLEKVVAEASTEAVAEAGPEVPKVSAGPSLDALRQQLAQNDLVAVLEQLEIRLSHQPEDVDAWFLLATTARKKGDRALQLQALQSVIRLDTGLPAQRARFKAAGLLADDPSGMNEARLLLVDFLVDPAGPGALEPDARLSLASIDLAAGDSDEAWVQLKQITEKFPGTAPAVEAGKLMTEISGK